MQMMNDGVIQRKHVGSHKRELPTLRGGLRRKASAQMRRRGGKKWKGDAQMRPEGGKMVKGNVPMKQLNVRQKKRADVYRWSENFRS